AQSLGLEALALADRTDEPHVGEKLHLDGLVALAGTRFAPPAVDVERERRRAETECDGPRRGGEQAPDPVPRLRVRRRIAPGRASERRLIDHRRPFQRLSAA